MTDQTPITALTTKPWSREGMVTLAADASNIQEWKILAKSTAAGHRASALLSRKPIANNKLEAEIAAHLKTFLVFTVDRAFLAELMSKSACQSWNHLVSVMPPIDIMQINRLNTVPLFDECYTPN